MSDPSKFSLFKRSNGTYYILYMRDGRRRWKSTGCRVRSDALKALMKHESLFKEQLLSISLAKFAEDLIAYTTANYAKSTVTINRIALNHLQQIAGDCSLVSISPLHVDQYKTKRIKDEVSPVTINVELRALRTIFNVAIRWQHVERNPFTGMRLMSVPERTPAFLTRDDFQNLLNVIKEGWIRELVVFAVLTGMRRGEALNLKWKNVDLSRKIIHIETDSTFKTKAGKRRVVPMNETVFSLLSQKAMAYHGSDFVFTHDGEPIDAGYLTHRFKDYVSKTKLDGRLHWHSLRHTFASWLVQDGVSLFEVQKLLGHSSAEMTMIYSHLLPDQMHQTVNRIAIGLG
jgi:integrase